MPQNLRVGFKGLSFRCFKPAGRRGKRKKLSSSKVEECVNLKSEMYLASLCFLNYNTSRLIKAHQRRAHSFLRAMRGDFNCKMLNLTIKGFVLLRTNPNTTIKDSIQISLNADEAQGRGWY